MGTALFHGEEGDEGDGGTKGVDGTFLEPKKVPKKAAL